jgi:hypothetical protein
MYGLKEASVLAYDQLKEHLAPYGYAPVRVTPGLWKHSTRPTKFTLAVDDFGIKYFQKADAEHLISALQDKYQLTQDWSGNNYLGMTLDWHYTAVRPYVDVSMPKFVDKGRTKYQHPSLICSTYVLWAKPIYGQKSGIPPPTHPTYSTKRALLVFKVLLVHFSIMVAPSITLSYRL